MVRVRAPCVAYLSCSQLFCIAGGNGGYKKYSNCDSGIKPLIFPRKQANRFNGYSKILVL